MKISPSKYAHALADALMEAENPTEAIQHFLHLLRRRKAIKFLPKILHAFEKEWKKRNALLELDIFAPGKFESSAKQVAEAVSKKSGKKVISHFHRDDALIGGVKIRFDDTLIDATVQYRLNQLATQFI